MGTPRIDAMSGPDVHIPEFFKGAACGNAGPGLKDGFFAATDGRQRRADEISLGLPVGDHDPETLKAKADEAQQQINTAKSVCSTCPVIDGCLRFALEIPAPGVWGGFTRGERDEILDALNEKGQSLEDTRMSDLTKPLKDYWRGQGGGAAKRGPSSLETAARGGTQPKRVRAVSEDAACRGVDPSTFKGDEGLQELVALCGSCPVRAACLAEGMDRDTEKKSPKRETAYAGVYGGFDRGQRDQLRQAATGVLNWDATLEHIWPIVEKDPSWQAPESIGFLAVNSAAAAARTKEVPLPTYNLPAAG